MAVRATAVSAVQMIRSCVSPGGVVFDLIGYLIVKSVTAIVKYAGQGKIRVVCLRFNGSSSSFAVAELTKN
jgi:hypothetical protein